MTPRAYSLGRRAEAAEETRRRIVETTYALHCEQGIAGTNITEIAQRAGVSVGTVYHHFATYDDVIMACGAHAMIVTRPPTPAIFDGADDATGRVERLVEGYCAFFERAQGFELLAYDRRKFEPVEGFMREFTEQRADLSREALRGTRPSPKTVATLAALLDVGVYRSLRETGLSPAQVSAQLTGVVTGWLCCERQQR